MMLLIFPGVASCVSHQRPAIARSQPFDVGIFGDMPYVTKPAELEEKTLHYRRALASIGETKLAFAVHIGDFAYAGQCSDSLYDVRKSELAAFPHPLIYLFGDNEWIDCKAPFDPAERIAALRARFAAAGAPTLGVRTLNVARQSSQPGFEEYSENTRWTLGGVLFTTLNVVGSNNNRGSDSVATAEHTSRTRANVAWLEAAFAEARLMNAAGVAVFMHANPLPSAAARAARPNGFAEVTTALLRLARELDKPVALVHGDTHYFRIDKPFEEAGTYRVYGRITRAETFGDPNSHWLRMRVDPADPDVFSFFPVLIPANLPRQ